MSVYERRQPAMFHLLHLLLDHAEPQEAPPPRLQPHKLHLIFENYGHHHLVREALRHIV
ncbi:MAG: hypothetical protein JRI25_02660 [Deltaproteobacteria bacterium]|nr:hypothetical protein [Deltaproteobacteria bacterium]